MVPLRRCDRNEMLDDAERSATVELTLEQELAHAFAARTKDLRLSEMLKDEMAATKAAGGPEAAAAFDEALRTEVLAVQPLRNIPVRST
jgi:hypothetical protein